MSFQTELPEVHMQKAGRQFKLLPIVSMLLAAFFASDGMAASIVSSSVNETSAQTELQIEFSEPIKEPVRMFKMSNPERKVVEFSNLEDYEKFAPQFEEGSRIKSAKIFSAQGRSRLILELPNVMRWFKIQKVIALS